MDLLKKRFKVLVDENATLVDEVIFAHSSEIMRETSYEFKAIKENTKSYKELLEYIYCYIEKKKKVLLKKKSEILIKTIKENKDLVLLDLLEGRNNIYDVSFHKTPIFNYIDIDKLFNTLIGTNLYTMHYFGGIIKDRYYIGKEMLFEEDIFLKKLLERCEEYVEENKGKLSSYNINEQIVKNLKIALDKIEKIKNENS